MPLLNQDGTGADSLKKRSDSLEHLEGFSREGLRTLLLASRPLESAFFGEWEQAYQAALLLPREEREQKMPQLLADMETSLQMVGVTAVEDKLQDGVPETIQK